MALGGQRLCPEAAAVGMATAVAEPVFVVCCLHWPSQRAGDSGGRGSGQHRVAWTMAALTAAAAAIAAAAAAAALDSRL